jgi:hypothetical protein
MNLGDINRIGKAPGFERARDVPPGPGATSAENPWNVFTILSASGKKTLAYVLGVMLLAIAIVFVSCRRSSIRQHWIPMSRQWPWISSIKASIQNFLRQAFRDTRPGRWVR